MKDWKYFWHVSAIFCAIWDMIRVSIGEGSLPWATSCLGLSRFFLNEKKINIGIFALYILLHLWKWSIEYKFSRKKIILYSFSYKVTFSMSKVHFWFFSFVETKSLNIDSFTNENKNKFNGHRSKVSPEKRKKVCCLFVTQFVIRSLWLPLAIINGYWLFI